jgi:serine/threonine protein kinase
MSLHINRRFKLGKRLGSGAFGEIYAGHEVGTGLRVAVKLEERGAKYPQLRYEARIYHTLDGTPGIPKMLYSGVEGGYNVLVLERLGSDIEHIRANTASGRLPLNTVLSVGDHGLRVIEQFHNRGFVHRDIKPDNFLTGPDGHGIFLIDFGLSKYVLDADGRHIPPSRGKCLTGTPRYASIANHRGREQGRRDDLESLGFVLLYLLRGSLPWKDMEDYDNIMRCKQDSLRRGKLYKDAPSCFRAYFHYISTLGFADKPDYKRLRALLRST